MTNAIGDLWPAMPSPTQTPLSILKAQAEYLSRKTKGVLSGDVSSQQEGNNFRHQFFIVAPLLNYRYHLFTVTHSVVSYPARVSFYGSSEATQLPKTAPSTGYLAKSEIAFLKILKMLFASSKTTQIISSLYSQSVSYEPPKT